MNRQRSCRDLCKFEGDKISFRCIIRYSQRRTQARAINCNHYESARLPDLRQFIIRYSGSKLSRNSIFPGRDKTQLRNSCPGTKIDYPYTFRGRCKIRNNSREKHRARNFDECSDTIDPRTLLLRSTRIFNFSSLLAFESSSLVLRSNCEI